MDRHPLTPGGNTLAILDTCVLLPSRLSDVLFDLMLEGLYFAYWTGDVPDGHPKLLHLRPPKLLHSDWSNRLLLVGLVLPSSHGNFSLNFL